MSVDKKVEITSKWDLVKLGEVAEIESDSRQNFIVRGEHIHNTTGYLNFETPKYMTKEFYNSSKSGKIKKDDVLICIDGAR